MRAAKLKRGLIAACGGLFLAAGIAVSAEAAEPDSTGALPPTAASGEARGTTATNPQQAALVADGYAEKCPPLPVFARQVIESAYLRLPQALNSGAARFAEYDAALPASPREAVSLGQNAVLMVLAQAIDAKDFPLKRAYVVVPGTGGKSQALTPIAHFRRRLPADSTAISAGAYVEASFYLLPLRALARKGELYVDFQSRPGFSLGQFPGGRSPRTAATVPGRPDPVILTLVLMREYPDWFPFTPSKGCQEDAQ